MSKTCFNIVRDDGADHYWPMGQDGVYFGDKIGDWNLYGGGIGVIPVTDVTQLPTCRESLYFDGSLFGTVLNSAVPYTGGAYNTGDSYDGVKRVSQNWCHELWVRPTGPPIDTNYSFITSITQPEGLIIEAEFRAGLPFANEPPYGFGFQVGINGWQLLGHRGDQLNGPGQLADLGDGNWHYFVIQGYDDPISVSTRVKVWLDASVVYDSNFDTNYWPDGPIYYSTSGFGGSTSNSYYTGYARKFALYVGKNLTQDQINRHFLLCSCSQSEVAPPLRLRQRDDILGLDVGTPRLTTTDAVNHPSSVQYNTAPRLEHGGSTYL